MKTKWLVIGLCGVLWLGGCGLQAETELSESPSAEIVIATEDVAEVSAEPALNPEDGMTAAEVLAARGYAVRLFSEDMTCEDVYGVPYPCSNILVTVTKNDEVIIEDIAVYGLAAYPWDEVLSPEDMSERMDNVPSDAVLGMQAWYAGCGDDFVVAFDPATEKLSVWQRSYGETGDVDMDASSQFFAVYAVCLQDSTSAKWPYMLDDDAVYELMNESDAVIQARYGLLLDLYAPHSYYLAEDTFYMDGVRQIVSYGVNSISYLKGAMTGMTLPEVRGILGSEIQQRFEDATYAATDSYLRYEFDGNTYCFWSDTDEGSCELLISKAFVQETREVTVTRGGREMQARLYVYDELFNPEYKCQVVVDGEVYNARMDAQEFLGGGYLESIQ